MPDTQHSVDPTDGSNDVQIEGAPTQAVDQSRTGDAMPRVAPDDRRKREDAVRFANASMFLEGFEVSTAERLRADRFIAGEIDLAEFLQNE